MSMMKPPYLLPRTSNAQGVAPTAQELGVPSIEDGMAVLVLVGNIVEAWSQIDGNLALRATLPSQSILRFSLPGDGKSIGLADGSIKWVPKVKP